MYFCNYCWLNPSLLPNKEKFGDVGCLLLLKILFLFDNIFFYLLYLLSKRCKSAKHEWKSKYLSSSLPVSSSNLSLVSPESGNASFPGETKLLLYHSGPQVFSAHWPSHASGGERERLLMPISHRHTQMLFVVPVLFQKAAWCPIGDSVPNWHATAVCNRRMYQTHNESLFVFFL